MYYMNTFYLAYLDIIDLSIPIINFLSYFQKGVIKGFSINKNACSILSALFSSISIKSPQISGNMALQTKEDDIWNPV